MVGWDEFHRESLVFSQGWVYLKKHAGLSTKDETS